MKKLLYTAANGCAVLRHETNRINRFFLLNGYTECNLPQEADVILFSGCGMTNEDVEFDIITIKRLIEAKKKNSIFIITGCLPPVYNVKSIANDLIILKYSELETLDEVIDAKIPLKKVRYNYGLSDHLIWNKPPIRQEYIEDKKLIKKFGFCPELETKMERILNYSTEGCYIWPENDIFQIRIAYGCSFACSYCSSTISVGNYHSIAIDDILSQYREGLQLGFTRYMLMGTELGMYGTDIGTNLINLIQRMYEINPSVEIGIRYIHPDCLVKVFNQLLKYIENGFVYYFCVALQTASRKLLQAMNRNDNLTPLIDCIHRIRNKKLPVMIHSQIMVGFPDETYEDIFDTLDMLDDCDFNYVNMNKFSSRPMTPAYNLPGQIDEEEKDRRLSFVKNWSYIKRQASVYKSIKQIKGESIY